MPEQVTQSRVVRRRNPRPINSCVECRQRKSRCSKTHPCQNCTAFGRECVFITVPESAAKRKQRESIGKAQPEWSAPLPVRTQPSENASQGGSTTTPGTPPRDFEWEAYQQHVEVDDDPWEKLPAEPDSARDDVYEDEDEDEDRVTTDLNIRIGRMVLTENVSGFFRPQYAEEIGKLLSDHPYTPSTVAGRRIPESSVLLDSEHVHPISPSLDLLFGASKPLPEFEALQLPTRREAETLFQRYLESVSPLAHVLHIPSFRRLFDKFWMNVEIGNPNQDSSTALVLAVCLAASATYSSLQSKAQFGILKEDLFQRLQSATERALLRANWAVTSNIRTLQALTIYLIPLCRAQISRATSVLIGSLVRLAQCIGIHRTSHNPSNHLTPLQKHVRSMLWYQICFLDFRAAEAQGPQPSIRPDDFDIPLPLNVDDDVFEFGSPQWQPEPTPLQGWTDLTLSLIRYECNELHRLILRGRIEIDRKSMTLHEMRTRVEARKRYIHSKHLRFLDASVPIQRYAGLVATLLLARCDSMLLYRHLPQASPQPRSEAEGRLRDVLLTAALTTLEIGATLDTLPSLTPWAWYSSTYQQYHAILLFLAELYRTPDLPRKDRMMTLIDHVFGHCYGVGIKERCSDLLWTVKENLEAYYIMRGVNKRKMTLQPPPRAMPRRQDTDISGMSLQGQMGAPPQALEGVGVNVDLEGLLGALNGGGAGNEGFDEFLAGMPSSDTGAIFMPVEAAGAGPAGGGGSEWMDGVASSGGLQGGGMQQWDSWNFPSDKGGGMM